MTFLEQVKQLEPATPQEYVMVLNLALALAGDLGRQLDDLHYSVGIQTCNRV